jgi:hypothetical protein
MTRKIRANHKIKSVIEEVHQWVREYYSDYVWDKITRVGYHDRYRIPTGWKNFSKDATGESLGSLPYPTEYTYQTSIGIMNHNVSFDVVKNKLMIKPYWWDIEQQTNTTGRSEMNYLVATKENVHRVLSTIPIDPRPTWLLLLLKRYTWIQQNVRKVFTRYYWRGKKYSHDKKHNPGRWLYSPQCTQDCLKNYFGENQWMWMVIGGRGLQRVEERWNNDEGKDTYKFNHHGFVFEFEYKSCPDELRRGDSWPYDNMWFRVMLNTPLGPGTGMFWGMGIERKEFEKLIRWIEQDYAPAQSWAGENDYDDLP